jgi:3-methyladenine DNA glycosylase/8-oxoguanine DNA glycosylase
MAKEIIKISVPKYYDLFMTCHAHGWINLAPFRWDDNSTTLHFPVFISSNPVDIMVRQNSQRIVASIFSQVKLSRTQVNSARELIVRALDLNTDTEALQSIAERVGEDYVEIIKKGAGRLLHAPTLWEDAAKTLFTTNCTWNLTQKMCEAACSATFSKPAPSGILPFPAPQTIAEYKPEQIQKLMPVGYRSEYLRALAKYFTKNPSLSDIESNNYQYSEADKLVRSFRGFGDYGVAHLLILSGYFNEIPIDTSVVSYLKNNHRVRKPKSFIDRTYRKWEKYKWWGLKLEKIIRQQNRLGD